ncbi:MAG: hypothetical protein WBC50_00800, partial [Dehalococcoidales bacterium]
AVYICWPAGIEYKINLLRSLLVASTALVGFTSIFLLKIISEGERFVRELSISERKMKNLRIFLSWSVIIGFLAILAVMFYFISYEIALIILAWILFILQLESFVLPLIFTKIITFR